MSAENPDIFDRIMALPGLNRFFNLYTKHKQGLLYLFFGGLTTAVSIVSFVLFDSVMHLHPLVANVLSWFCAVLFAYFTNRTWVFRSAAAGRDRIHEILYFFGGRMFSLGVEEAMLLVLVVWLQLNSTLIKLLAQVVVLVLNYVISKWLVFQKR